MKAAAAHQRITRAGPEPGLPTGPRGGKGPVARESSRG